MLTIGSKKKLRDDLKPGLVVINLLSLPIFVVLSLGLSLVKTLPMRIMKLFLLRIRLLNRPMARSLHWHVLVILKVNHLLKEQSISFSQGVSLRKIFMDLAML